MQINTTSLATLKAFTQFTARATVKESDIAKIDTTRASFKPLRITTATGDRAWWALSRTATSKVDNNEVRSAFKKAVSDIFGGEDKIPESKAYVLVERIPMSLDLDDFCDALRKFIDTLEDCVKAAANFGPAMESAGESLKNDEPPAQFGSLLGGFMRV